MSQKKKGNRGENVVASLLNKQFETGFKKGPSSGALSTIYKGFIDESALVTLTGDLIVPKNWVFSIESKAGYEADISKLFTSKKLKSKLFGFVEQTSEDALRIEGRIPLVVYKRDYREHVAILPYHNHSREKELKKLLKDKIKTYMIFHHKVEDSPWSKWVIITFQELLDKAPKSFFFDGKEE